MFKPPHEIWRNLPNAGFEILYGCTNRDLFSYLYYQHFSYFLVLWLYDYSLLKMPNHFLRFFIQCQFLH